MTPARTHPPHTPPTGDLVEPGAEGELRQLFHDVQNCLNVIGMGTELLRSARGDDAKFAELCGVIDEERRKAARLLRAFVEAGS